MIPYAIKLNSTFRFVERSWLSFSTNIENSLPILPVAENTSGAKVPCLTIKILELCFSTFFLSGCSFQNIFTGSYFGDIEHWDPSFRVKNPLFLNDIACYTFYGFEQSQLIGSLFNHISKSLHPRTSILINWILIV